MSLISAYFATLIVFIGLDVFWLGFLMKNFYSNQLGSLTKENPHVGVGLIVWALIVFGIFNFVLPLCNTYQTAIVQGALFGFVLYAVYELTNYIYLSQWPVNLVAVDTAWGCFICSVAALVGYYLTQR
jgi:uncharacterized membrane protein